MLISPFKIIILFSVLSVFGLMLLPQLSVQLNPSDEHATLTVSYDYSSASSFSVESQVTAVLESGFSVLQGVKKITSSSEEGTGTIILELDKNNDIDNLRFEVATIIRQLYNKLPNEVSYPIISLNKPNEEKQNNALLIYTIFGDTTPSEIQDYVMQNCSPTIVAINGVSTVSVYGANQKEWFITYNPDKLNLLNISKNDIITSLQECYNSSDLGVIKEDNKILNVTLNNPNTLFNTHIPVKKVNGKIIYLDDIASVVHKEQESQDYFRVNGKNAITMAVYAEQNVNTIKLAQVVESSVKKMRQQLPKTFSINQSYNASDYLSQELNKIYSRSFYTVLLLFLFVLLASRSYRYVMILIVGMTTTLAISLIFYYFFKIEIQLYSLAGVTISLGLIIDNTIIMMDHLRKNNNLKVFLPLLAATLTTIGALSAIYFLDEKYKQNLIDFAWVIIINLGVSLFTALLLIPALLKRFPLRVTKEKKIKSNDFLVILYEKILLFLLKYKKLTIVSIILLFGLPIFMLPVKMEENQYWYEKLYNDTIGNEWFNDNLRPFCDTYLGGTFRLFSTYVFENANYQNNEETKLYVSASMEKGATVHQMNTAFIELDNYLNSFTQIKQFTTQVQSADRATIEVVFKKEFEDSAFPFILKSQLISKVLDFGGMDWEIYGVGDGFRNGGSDNEPINFKLKAIGYNYTILSSWADSLKTQLEKHPRVQNVIITDNSFYGRKKSFEYQFKFDKEKLALYQTNSFDAFQSINDKVVSKFSNLYINVNGSNEAVRFESKNASKFDLWNVKNEVLQKDSSFINLKSIASISKEPNAEKIDKENQEYVRIVAFQYAGNFKFGNDFLEKNLNELKLKLPLGYKFEKDANLWDFNEEKKNNYIYLLFLIIVLIYFICSILFESLTQPLIILSVIPISFIGVFVIFYLFDFNFDQGGFASFVLLSGISVNSSIFLLNEFNYIKKEKIELNVVKVFILAYKNKIIPIGMTVLSTILGFLPFVINGQNEVFWFALAIGTIGGLLFTIIAITFFLPIFCIKKPKSYTND